MAPFLTQYFKDVFSLNFSQHSNIKHVRGFHPQSGLTLIEVIAVLVIIVGIIGLVGPQIFKQLEKSRVKTTYSQIELLSTSLDAFRLENGRYPTTEEGLIALVERPDDLPTWDGPYLRKKALPKDSWNQDFMYARPATMGGIDYDLYSYGADGEEGGEGVNADIGNW